MNTNTATRRLLSLVLSFCLIMPAATTAFASGKGKKNFNEGQKYESALQWDLAAQAFALAVSAEPNNPEYRLHYLRALQQASLMYVKRGDALSEQNDYAGAYTAFRTAYNYDQGNEIARIKMEGMLAQQKAIANGVEPVNFGSSGNVRPTADIQIASRPRNRDIIQNVAFKDANVKSVINTLGKQLSLNVLFDDAIKEEKMSVDMSDVTLTKAFDSILFMKKLTFEQMDRRTIIVYQDNPTNKPRFEKLMVKAFYLGNINASQARNAVTLALGNQRQIQTLDTNAGGPGGGGGAGGGGNILLVKATPQELQLVQQILEMVDKNKNEVVLDVEIYEVSHDSMTQIGNQIGTKPVDFVAERTSTTGTTTTVTQEAVKSAGLSNLGGFGLNILDSKARAGNTLFSTGFGAMIGLPPTTISLLQSKGNSKLLNKTQIHVLDGQANTTKVGKSVPVRLGTQYGLSGYNTGQVNGTGAVGGAIGGALGGALGGYGAGIDSIQYRDVGLVIEATPTITNEGYVEVKMKFETSDVAASGSSSDLTPTFTQRSLQTVARIKDGVTSVVAGVNQDNRGDSRAGIPVLGMIPILGRLFATPQQTANSTDIVITVTPHIIRSAGITQKDYLAIYAGGASQQGSGLPPSIEDVVFRAQQEEEQERRLIAEKSPGLQQELPLTPDNGTQGGRAVSGNQVANMQPAANTNVQPLVNQQRSAAPAPAQRNNAPVRTIDNNSMIPVSSVTSGAPIVQPPPQMPDQQPTSISDAPPTDPAPAGSGKEGEPAESQMIKPENPVPMAVPFSGQDTPERLEKMAKIRQANAAEIKRLADEEAANKKNKKQPESYSMPLPDGIRGPKTPVGQALPTMQSARNNINFSLSTPNRQQMGKNFNVTVDVSGQGQMMGATLAIRFDESKVQVKSVRSGNLFGSQPVLSSNIEKGLLNVSIKSPQKTGVAANGQMIIIEFAAVAEGSTEIAFNNADTKVSLIGNMSVPAKGTAAQVVISRDGVASATNER